MPAPQTNRGVQMVEELTDQIEAMIEESGGPN